MKTKTQTRKILTFVLKTISNFLNWKIQHETSLFQGTFETILKEGKQMNNGASAWQGSMRVRSRREVRVPYKLS